MDTYDGEPVSRHRRLRFFGILIGAGAVAAMTTFALAQPDSASSGANVPLAGSGDAPAYTTYSQPTILHMKVGDTAVVTTPAISPLG